MESRRNFRNGHFGKKVILTAVVLLVVFGIVEHFSTVQRGLRGDYYRNIDRKGTPAFSRVDSTIDLGTAHIRRLVFPHEMYGIHWTGWVYIEHPGTYTFWTKSDDGSSLSINGKQVVDNLGSHGPEKASGDIELNAGFHQIEITYFQGTGRDYMRAYWQLPGQEEPVPLPSEILFPTKPLPGRLFLEQMIPRGAFILKIVVPLLLGLTLFLNREQFFRHAKGYIYTHFTALNHIGTAIGFRLRGTSSRQKKWAIIGLGAIIIAFYVLYWLQSLNGLVGTYYDNQEWNGTPVFSTCDASLDPRNLYKEAGRLQEPNSLRWTGWIWVPKTAEYHIALQSDGIISLDFNSTPILEKRDNDHIETLSEVIFLPKGVYRLELKYLPGTGTSHILDIRWGQDESSLKAFPGDFLFREQPARSSLYLRYLNVLSYKSVRTLLAVLVGLATVLVLTNQRALYDRFLQTSVFRTLSNLIGRQASIRHIFKHTWVHLVLIILLTFLLVFNNLGRGSIITTDFDEGIHTRVAQYMAKTGIWWGLYTAKGIPYYNKPPLKIWLSALTFKFLGDSEFFIRIWDAVFGLLTFIVLYFFGTYLFSDKTVGLLAVLILMGSRDFLFTHNVRTGVMDSLMLFFFCCSLFFFYFRKKKPYFYYFAGVCLGLGTLTKSVQGLVPLLIIVLYIMFSRETAEFKTLPFWGMVFLALLLPALWYVPHFFLSPSFFRIAVVEQIFHRVQGKIHQPHLHGPLFFFRAIYNGFFPWSIVALPVIGIGVWQARWRKRREMAFLLTWIFSVFLGFSLSKMKVVWYMHPLYPALSMLIAIVVYSAITTLKNSSKYPLLSPLILGGTIVFLSCSIYANYERALEQPEKLPIHVFTDYVLHLKDTDYRVVLFDVDIQDLTYEDQYYLDRLDAQQLIRTDDIAAIEQLYRQNQALFVIIKRKDYDRQPFFRKHQYGYWLAPIYANTLYFKKLVLVYNHIPDNAWFIKH